MNNSRLILGTAQFGMDYGINNREGKPSVEKVFEILDLAAAKQITQLDTADLYGDAQQIIGEYIKTHKGNFLVNTKFKSEKERPLEMQLHESLEQLGLKNINSFFFHRFQEMQHYPELLHQLTKLKGLGLIKKTGVSVYWNDEFQHSINEQQVDVIQVPFNLLDNYSRRGDLLRLAKEKGKEIQVRSIFLQGLFFRDRQSFPVHLQPLLKYLDQLDKLASAYKLSMHDLALGYVLKKKEIDFIVIGVDSAEQLQRNIDAERTTFDDELEKEIDRMFVKEEPLLYPFNWT